MKRHTEENQTENGIQHNSGKTKHCVTDVGETLAWQQNPKHVKNP